MFVKEPKRNVLIHYMSLYLGWGGLISGIIYLQMETLKTCRCFLRKATFMYKILKDLSTPQLNNSFAKVNDTNINYNLRNVKTNLALPRPYTNFLKHSFEHSGAMLWNNFSYEAKTAQSLSGVKHKLASSLPCLLLDCSDSMQHTSNLKSLINYLKYIYT